MSKLENKFLENYSVTTLRDIEVSGLANGDYLAYDSSDQKFKNVKPPRFGMDFAEESTSGLLQVTGNQFTTYAVLNFTVSLNENNKYRINTNFTWNHNNTSTDIRVRLLLDGAQIGEEFRVEPKDSNADQRLSDNILRYVSNLSQGNHSISLQFRPSSSSRISRMYQSTIEVWRVN